MSTLTSSTNTCSVSCSVFAPPSGTQGNISTFFSRYERDNQTGETCDRWNSRTTESLRLLESCCIARSGCIGQGENVVAPPCIWGRNRCLERHQKCQSPLPGRFVEGGSIVVLPEEDALPCSTVPGPPRDCCAGPPSYCRLSYGSIRTSVQVPDHSTNTERMVLDWPFQP